MTILPSSAHPPLPAIAVEAQTVFARRFGHPPRWLSVAPGRVNLIGEHVDYNDGLVLPVAIDRYTAIAAGPAQQDTTIIESLDKTESIQTTDYQCEGQPAWAPYTLGPLLLFQRKGLRVDSFEAIVASDVPRGAGLSSSAALEVATATLAELICGQSLAAMEKARLCQQAEHEFANVPCGIMDQAASVASRANMALLLDCQTESWTNIPFGQSDVCLLIANTNVRHSLADGQYATRRQECDLALGLLGKSSYRQVSPAALQSDTLELALKKRASHVVFEIARTKEAATALEAADWIQFGKLMNESHRSLSEDYQVSCAELDTMARIAWDLGPSRGVFGSRMTGGGFGGCTVSLVLTARAASVADALQQAYHQETGIEPEIFIAKPSEGAWGVDCEPPQQS